LDLEVLLIQLALEALLHLENQLLPATPDFLDFLVDQLVLLNLVFLVVQQCLLDLEYLVFLVDL